jgi:ABC-2 type transport system permease protein
MACRGRHPCAVHARADPDRGDRRIVGEIHGRAVAFSYPIIFRPFISSAFVPTASMPGPVRAFAENQPVTSIVNTIRGLFGHQPLGGEIWIGLAWCVGILLIAYAVAMVAYRRKIA